MALPHKPSTTAANPLGPYPSFPALSAEETKRPELVSYHAKLEGWYEQLQKVLLREREEIQS